MNGEKVKTPQDVLYPLRTDLYNNSGLTTSNIQSLLKRPEVKGLNDLLLLKEAIEAGPIDVPYPCVDHSWRCSDWASNHPESCKPDHQSYGFMRAACPRSCKRCKKEVSSYTAQCGSYGN